MNECDYDCRTGLHLAASEGRLESAAFLLNEAAVNPNALDRFMLTPLDDAIRHGKGAIESLIRESGGLTGDDPAMAEEVNAFRISQEEEKLKKDQLKLERELKSAEVSRLADGLARFAKHVTFEEDIYAYVNHAESLRTLLIRFLAKTSDGSAPMADSEITKDCMEKLLEQASAG